MTWRNLELTPQRFERWWEKFHVEHPGVGCRIVDQGVELASSDGSLARFTGWYPVGGDDDPIVRLLQRPREVGLILLRRGGYSVGLATEVDADHSVELLDHKTGTRYVQARTAAGGWSQQRFARRRENQADELLRVTIEHAARILAPLLEREQTERGVVVGGDALLIEEVLADPKLQGLRGLVRREFWDLPDPRFKVLQDTFRRSRMVKVAVYNP